MAQSLERMTEPQIIPVACIGDCYRTAIFDSASVVVAIIVGAMLRRWYFAFPMGLAVALVAPLTWVAWRAWMFGDAQRVLPLAYPIEHSAFRVERVALLGLIIAAILIVHGILRIITYLRGRDFVWDGLLSIAAGVIVTAGTFALVDAYDTPRPPPPPPAEDASWDLPIAARGGQFDKVRALLASPRKWPHEALTQTLVEVAYAGAGDDLVRALLARGADVNGRGLAQQSILALAAQAGLAQPVATLLAAGADIKATDQWGETALHQTEFFNPEIRREPAGTDRGAIVDLLVKAGIPVDARDEWRHTPLIDNRSGHENVARALIAHGADVNAQDSDGSTPLMTNDNPTATALLLAAGANPFLCDLDGLTVLDNRDRHGKLDHREAIAATIERWVAAHPAQARRAREEAAQVGSSRVPKRYEPPETDIQITPINRGPSIYSAFAGFEFALIIIAQLLTAYALAFVAWSVWKPTE